LQLRIVHTGLISLNVLSRTVSARWSGPSRNHARPS